jgi:hypothetical protein
MEELRHINWSEVVRRAIMEVIEREERLRKVGKDRERLRKAALETDRLSRSVPRWSSVEEIRRWREERKMY